MAIQRNAYASSSRRQLDTQDEDDDMNGSSGRSQTRGTASHRSQNGRTVNGNRDEDEDEDESGPRGRRQGNGEEEEEEVEDGVEIGDIGEGWTIETFTSRPIPRADWALSPLSKVCQEIMAMIRTIESSLEHALEAAKALEDANEGDEGIKEVETLFLEMLEQRRLAMITLETIEDVRTRLRANEGIEDLEGGFEQEVDAAQAEYLGKTRRQKFKEEKKYIEFRESIWEINHPDEACPLITTWLPREAGDVEEGDDDEVESGAVTQTFRCPITMRPLEDACINTICGHAYSYKAALELINVQRGRNAVKCPCAGCNKPLSKDKLQKKPELQKRAEQYELRMLRRQQQAMDAEDIEEL